MKRKEILKCIKAFNLLETEQDLKRAKITQSEHFEIGRTLSEAVNAYNQKRSYKGETISQSVCDWFIKQGAKVNPCGIGWYIIF